MRALIAVLATLAMAGPVLAQGDGAGFRYTFIVTDGAFPGTPRFSVAPTVVVYVLKDPYDLRSDALTTFVPSASDNPPVYSYEQVVLPRKYLRRYLRMDVTPADGEQYYLQKPSDAVRTIEDDDLGTGNVSIMLKLYSPAQLANLYRSEANGVLKQGNLDETKLTQAYSAAVSAIEMNPITDNYLIAIKVARYALKRGIVFDGMPISKSNLRALKSFDDLSFSERWSIESDLLATFANAPDLDLEVARGVTASDAAVELANQMLQSIDFANPEDTAMPVTQVQRTLAALQGARGDCIGLIDSSGDALSHADATQMKWEVRRSFFLEWADCLERLSGIGDGRAEADFILQTAANPGLRAHWMVFAGAGLPYTDQLLYPTNSSDERLKRIFERADLIRSAGK
jgi:hypothetical protein